MVFVLKCKINIGFNRFDERIMLSLGFYFANTQHVIAMFITIGLTLFWATVNYIHSSNNTPLTRLVYPEFEYPWEEDSNEVNFIVFNSENPTGKSFSSSEKVDFIDPNKMTKIIIHGWRNDHNSEMPQNMMKAYLENHDVNIVIVGWGYYSLSLNYLYAVKAKSLVARKIAEFILTNLHTDQEELNVHFIGHSLGAQVSADVGYLFRANGRHVYRITGLDPAHPFINKGLNYDHAFFVDIIRTTAGTLSAWDPSGHADFYPNGGKIPQPCCTGILPMCSHSAAWKYYLYTITNQTRYRAHKCNSYQSYVFGYCTIKTYMGEGANVEIRGTFYLDTDV